MMVITVHECTGYHFSVDFGSRSYFIPNPKKQGCTHHGGNELANPAWIEVDAKLSKQPASEGSTYETEKQIDEATFALTSREFASKQSGYYTYYYRTNHCCLSAVCNNVVI
jgi:hypothetical protein